MRDIARSEMCKPVANQFEKCAYEAGGWSITECRGPLKDLTDCLEKWFYDPQFKERVTLEYLNERSHFRQTKVKSQRYLKGKFIERDQQKDGPALGEEARGWDEMDGRARGREREASPTKAGHWGHVIVNSLPVCCDSLLTAAALARASWASFEEDSVCRVVKVFTVPRRFDSDRRAD